MDKLRFTLKKNEVVSILMEEILSNSKVDVAYKLNALNCLIDGYVENDVADMTLKYTKLLKEYKNCLVGYGAISRFERKFEIVLLIAERNVNQCN